MLKKSNMLSVLGKLLLSSVVAFSFNLNAIAMQNKLSAVEVNNSVNGYQVILRADKPTVIRKNIQSTDEILITVKNIVPVESVATIYNNVPDVDSVMIEPDARDNIKILVHGKDIYKTNVAFGAPQVVAPPQSDTLNSEETAGTSDEALNEDNDTNTQTSENVAPKTEVELAAPIQAYAPVYNQDSPYELNNQPSYEDMAKSAARMTILAVKNASPIAGKIYHKLARVDKKLLALGGIFMIIILAGIKGLGNSKDNDLKIGLAQSLKENGNTVPESLGLAANTATLRTQNPQKAGFSPNINYGIKAYNQSQKNPYTQQTYAVQPQKNNIQQSVPSPSLKRRTVSQEEIARNLALIKQQQKFAQAPVTQPKLAPNPKIKMSQRQASGLQVNNVDSVKFLESMAKIYERSGREDLAKGLKSNIQRMQASNLQETAS